jgi:hypothetical protein
VKKKVKRGKFGARRVSRDQVRQNAKRGAANQQWFKLPKNVREWVPDKPGKYNINIVPYVVSDKAHPDGVDEGVLWYKRPFSIHRNVGPSNLSIVCPASIGHKCPICEEKASLAKNWQENKDQIQAISAQKFMAYPIIDPDDEDRIAVFALSRGKFAAPLDKELEDGDDDIMSFYDVTDVGRTLRVRFTKSSFAGFDFLEATRFDFVPREAMDEDAVLAKVPCLDTIFNVMEYDKLKALFLQLDDEDDTDDDEDDEKPTKSKSAKAKAKKPVDDDTDDDDADDTDDDDADDDDADDTDDDDADDDDADDTDDDDADDTDDDDEEDADDTDDDDADDEKDEKPKAKLGKRKAKVESKKPLKGKPAKEVKKEKASKGKPGKKNKCPHGHKFGKDCDSTKDCENCKVWKECDAAANAD